MQRLSMKEPTAAGFAAIQRIAETWMPNRREMHANLMHPARVGLHPHQRRASFVGFRGVESREHRDMADCVARRIRSHRHPLALDWMPSDGPLDRHAVAREFALDDRQICFRDGAILELSRKCGARKRRARHDHHARRVFVQAMHNSGPQHAVGLGHRGQLGKSREQSIDECAVGMPGRRMHRHPGGLVHDDYFVVVEDY